MVEKFPNVVPALRTPANLDRPRLDRMSLDRKFLVRLCLYALLSTFFSPATFAQMSPPPPVASPSADLPAPTKLHAEPRNHLLFRLGGDFAVMRHSTGYLDRAARLQERVRAILQGVERWLDVDKRLLLDVYVMTHDDWELERFSMPFGVPIRVGSAGIAAPARGTDQTIALWRDLLQGHLPEIAGTPIRGTAEELASLAVSDVFVQVLVGEIATDHYGLAGDEFWVRGVMSHLIAALAVVQIGTDRPQDIEYLYGLLGAERGERAFAAEDYDHDLKLEDWLWFQAQFHLGARILIEKEGKGALKKMLKLAKKNDGVLSGDALRQKYERLDEWYRTRFATVSMRRSR